MPTRHVFRLPRRVAVVGLVLLTASALVACETPVYRFAMYRWAPEAYSVYYLYEGEPSAAHQAVLDRLDALRFGDDKGTDGSTTTPINIDVVAVDTAENDVSAVLPQNVTAAWQKSGGALPTFLVMAPGGRLLYDGELSVDDANALVDSPARQTAARLLDVDHVVVFYVLENEDAKANDAAQETVRDVIDLADAGALAGDDSLSGTLIVDVDAANTPTQLAAVTVSRKDPAERWLVRMLLGIEDDLKTFKEPMVFPVFGRGRALEPFIGRGITTDNLASSVSYVSGSCSCEIKEQNPGMDLLTRWDWEATATALAERVGEEEGNNGLLSPTELFPTIIVATSDSAHKLDETTSVDDTADDDQATDDESITANSPDDATATENTAADATLVAVAATTESVDSDETSAADVEPVAPTAAANETSTDDAPPDWTVAVDPAKVAAQSAADATDAKGSAEFQQRWARNLMLGGLLAVVVLVVVSMSVIKSRPSV